MNLLILIGTTIATYFTVCGIIALRSHNKFMRELENRQKMRREKAERLKGIKL